MTTTNLSITERAYEMSRTRRNRVTRWFLAKRLQRLATDDRMREWHEYNALNILQHQMNEAERRAVQEHLRARREGSPA